MRGDLASEALCFKRRLACFKHGDGRSLRIFFTLLQHDNGHDQSAVRRCGSCEAVLSCVTHPKALPSCGIVKAQRKKPCTRRLKICSLAHLHKQFVVVVGCASEILNGVCTHSPATWQRKTVKPSRRQVVSFAATDAFLVPYWWWWGNAQLPRELPLTEW